MALYAEELDACFLGGIMPELNNTVLYKHEDLLCTLVLKVILLTWQGLGVGELTSAKFLPESPSTLDSLRNWEHSLLSYILYVLCI